MSQQDKDPVQYAETRVPLAALLAFIDGAEHYCPTCPDELRDTYIDAQGLRAFLAQYDGSESDG